MDDERTFRVQRRHDGDVVVVTPQGDIDLLTVAPIRAELETAQSQARIVVLDLRAVTFIDSSGVRLLVEAEHAAQRDGFAFSVVRGPAPVERLLDLAGLSDRLTLIDDPADATGAGDGNGEG